jgi:glycosyltransferase involved in cell wall biosynthesis
LQIIVDGIIYSLQSTGGISRLFSEVLPRMCEIEETLQITLLTDRNVSSNLPRHQRIEHKIIPPVSRYLRPERLWRPIIPYVRQYVRKLSIGSARGKIWHTTYYTEPKEKGVPVVVSLYDMIFERFPDFFSGAATKHFNKIKRRCVMAADAVLCISETTRQDVINFYGLNQNRAHVIHLACSNLFRKMENQEIDYEMSVYGPYFLYVGSRVHYKKFDLLLDALSKYKQKGIGLLVVGPPWSDEEIKRMDMLKIRDRVRLLSGIDDEMLCRLYNRAEAFIYPSLYEGFGIPLLEAMACGCPVIASRIPTTVEVAGDCPIYIEPDELDDMINAFDIVLSEGRNSDRVRDGFEQAKRYSWYKTAAKTLDAYRLLC